MKKKKGVKDKKRISPRQGACRGVYKTMRGAVIIIHEPLSWHEPCLPCPACFWYKEALRERTEKEALDILLPF